MKPIRIQRKRTKGWKMPENTVSVTRPGKWGNPFKVGVKYENSAWLACMFSYQDFIKIYEEGLIPKTIEECINLYKIHIEAMIKIWPESTLNDLEKLRGKNLACFCKKEQKCHADVLLEIANK